MDSIRTLPFSAEFGFSLIFFYIIAGLLFFIPSALISAELGTGWPETGGLYVWVREAFGKKCASIIIWLNWVYNLAWYPTIMALITATIAYLFDPSLAQNKFFMIIVILSLFWIATYLNCLGMNVSSWISTIGAIIGTLLPMLFIIVLAIIYLSKGHASEIEFSWRTFFPMSGETGKLPYFSNVLFGLLGLEMVATHAAEMKNPQRDYPKALFVSVLIILASIVCSSLAIAIVVPHGSLSLVTGTLQAFSIFFHKLGISWFVPIIAICIFLGGISGVSAWIIGPTKGVMVSSRDGHLPKFFTKKNSRGVPTNALITQAVIVTILSFAFVFMPTVNSSFWLLSVITAQLAMIVYISLFAAAVKLHHHRPEVERTYKIPGGDLGIWLTSFLGIAVSLFALFVGFIPPTGIQIHNVFVYECLLVGGMIILCLIPLFFSLGNRKSV